MKVDEQAGGVLARRADREGFGVVVRDANLVARLTRASATPSSLRSAFSMRPTQDAQVIPPMSRVHVSAVSAAASAAAYVVVLPGGVVMVMPSSQGSVVG